MKMTPEGKLQAGKFGSESGRMIGGAVMERTGSRSAELLLAGDGRVIAHWGSCRRLSASVCVVPDAF